MSGRAANFMSRHLPGLTKWGTRRHVKQYRESGGQKGADFRGKPVFLLDVVGRKTGESRPVMLMLVERRESTPAAPTRGDRPQLIVVGSNGGNPVTPNWYKNLIAAGGGEVEVRGERWKVTVRELPEGAERDECWAIANEAYPDFDSYQELTDRRIPVAVLDPA
jgi:deazaflavin-dependent oxidoreductase (nitroreductase family)